MVITTLDENDILALLEAKIVKGYKLKKSQRRNFKFLLK